MDELGLLLPVFLRPAVCESDYSFGRLCVFCGSCVEACPVDAIRMDTGQHPAPYDSRDQFIFRKDLLMGFTGRDGSRVTANPRHEPGDPTPPGLSRDHAEH